MIQNRHFISIVLFISALLFFSCNNDVAESDDTQSSATEPSSVSYTVLFDGNGGKVLGQNTSVASPMTGYVPASNLVVDLRGGYLFTGWNSKADGTGYRFTATTVVSENMTVYANWYKKDCKVLFDDNGGEKGETFLYATKGKAMPALSKLPARDGYLFDGYWEKNNFGALTTQYYDRNGESAKEYDGNISYGTLYAKWDYVYTITLSNTQISAYGAVSLSNSTTWSQAAKIAKGRTSFISALTVPVSADSSYIFKGYYVSSDYTVANGFVQVVDADGNLVKNVTGYTDSNGAWTNTATSVTLYARWYKPLALILVQDNDVTNRTNTPSATITVATGWPVAVSTLTLPTVSNPNTTKFYGYYTTNTYEGVSFISSTGNIVSGVGGYTNASGTWIATNNVTVYERWSYSYALTLDYSAYAADGVTISNAPSASAQVQFMADALSIGTPVTISTASYGLQGYYTSATANLNAAVKIANGNGTLCKNVTGYTDADGKWVRQKADGVPTLYARWGALLSSYSGTPDTNFWSTNYSSNTSFIIDTADKFAGMVSYVNSGHSFSGKTVTLETNLSMNSNASNYASWGTTPPAHTWTPIGTGSEPFRGTFDGAGYVIDGVYINSTNSYQAVFGSISHATIKNLNITNCYVKGANYVGILIGYDSGSSTIDSCTISGMIVASSTVGSIAGRVHSGTVIKNCTNNATVTATGGSKAGGLIGEIYYDMAITNCTNNGSISAYNDAGGICGHADAGYIAYNCVNNGSITTQNNNCGGIIGSNGWHPLHIVNCQNNGSITAGGNNAGGIAGSLNQEIQNIYNSVNTASVKAVNYVGGIIGYTGVESYRYNCLNTGAVTATTTGTKYAGGIDGYQNDSSTIAWYSYWLDSTATTAAGHQYGSGSIIACGSFSSGTGPVTLTSGTSAYCTSGTTTAIDALNGYVSATPSVTIEFKTYQLLPWTTSNGYPVLQY